MGLGRNGSGWGDPQWGPRFLEAEATGGVVGRDREERGAPAPPLPLDRQNMRKL